MPGSNKNSDPNRNTDLTDREESGMRGSPNKGWDEEEEGYDKKKDSSSDTGNMGSGGRKGNSGNTGGSSGGRSGGM